MIHGLGAARIIPIHVAKCSSRGCCVNEFLANWSSTMKRRCEPVRTRNSERHCCRRRDGRRVELFLQDARHWRNAGRRDVLHRAAQRDGYVRAICLSSIAGKRRASPEVTTPLRKRGGNPPIFFFEFISGRIKQAV